MEIIDTKKLSLNEFLTLLSKGKPNSYYPKYHFPTDQLLAEFLDNVSTYSQNVIMGILRKFIIHNCTFGIDELYRKYYMQNTDKLPDELKKTEYYRRLILASHPRDCVWEGLTWVLDLLPFSPGEAIRVIETYYLANIQFLPEDQLIALSECITIIRARFINIIPIREQLLVLHPLEFEMLVAELYKNLGYTVHLTKKSYDGGVDIVAEKSEVSQKEKLLIQCKRFRDKVTVKDIRELLGVVADGKATKGTLISTAFFTKAAIKFAAANPRIELINFEDFAKLCNTHLGSNWANRIDNIILDYKKENDGSKASDKNSFENLTKSIIKLN